MEIMEEYHPKTSPITGKTMKNEKVEEIADKIVKCAFDDVKNQIKNNMKPKELDFREILKYHIREKFFSPLCGEVILLEVDGSICKTVTKNGNKVRIISFCTFETGCAPIYPSKELFLKYPLDAEKAWEEWKAEIYDSGVVGSHEKKEKETEWEERRFLISTAMLPVLSQAVVRVENGTIVKHSKQECVEMAVGYADSLIEELKKETNASKS